MPVFESMNYYQKKPKVKLFLKKNSKSPGNEGGAYRPEVESSRTSLVSRTHFEVLGLGLAAQILGLEV